VCSKARVAPNQFFLKYLVPPLSGCMKLMHCEPCGLCFGLLLKQARFQSDIVRIDNTYVQLFMQ
jgi:hypothetical protein